MARLGGVLFAAGGTFTLASLALPGGAGQDALAILVMASIAYVFGFGLLAGGERVPVWLLHVLGACATGLVSAGVVFGGEPSVYPFLYFWVVLYFAYLFPWAEALGQLGLVVVGYGVALLVSHGVASVAPALWLLGAGTLTGVAVLVAVGQGWLEEARAKERARTEAARIMAAKAEKKALGRHVHGRVPYGYESERGLLRPVDDLVPIVRRIYTDAEKGESPGGIARNLNRAGIAPPQRGKAWTEQGVRIILTNPAYAGIRYGVRDAHPAIVNRRVWDRVQAALNERAKQR